MVSQLRTQSWNSTGGTHNSWVIETKFLWAELIHGLVNSAQGIFIINNDDGAAMAKYGVDSDDVYIGSGRVEYENPDEDVKFDGRIIKVRHNTVDNTVILFCKDWASQLDERKLDYETRRDLDGFGTRISQAKSDLTSLVEVAPVFTSGASYYLVDDDMTWDPDEWNGDYLFFDAPTAFGDIEFSTGPYDESVTGANVTNTPASGWVNIWEDDSDRHLMEGSGAPNIVAHYDFHIFALDSSLFNKLFDAELEILYDAEFGAGGTTNIFQVSISNIAHDSSNLLSEPSTVETAGDKVRVKIPISHDELLSFIDANGDTSIKIEYTVNTPNTSTLSIYTLLIHLKLKMDIEEDYYEIIDTLAAGNRLVLDTDLSVAGGLGIWEGIPYSIIGEAHTHINGLVTGSDVLETMTTDVESTAGIVGIRYIDQTALEIISAMAFGDKSVWWVALGTLELIYKQTFDAEPAAMNDDDVIAWAGGEFDWESMFNEAIVYGERRQTSLIRVKSSNALSDPGDTSQAKYDITRSRVIKQAGLKSFREAMELAIQTVERESQVNLFLSCTIPGFSPFELGDEVRITSIELGLTNEDYVVTHFAFNEKNWRTILRLHPRSSDGYVKHLIFTDAFFDIKKQVDYTALTRDIWKHPGDDVVT